MLLESCQYSSFARAMSEHRDLTSFRKSAILIAVYPAGPMKARPRLLVDKGIDAASMRNTRKINQLSHHLPPFFSI